MMLGHHVHQLYRDLGAWNHSSPSHRSSRGLKSRYWDIFDDIIKLESWFKKLLRTSRTPTGQRFNSASFE